MFSTGLLFTLSVVIIYSEWVMFSTGLGFSKDCSVKCVMVFRILNSISFLKSLIYKSISI